MAMRLDSTGAARPRFRTPATAPTTASALRRRYSEYCRRQAVGLVELVPREGVRPLYRQAREWAVDQGMHESKDPMATLHLFCRNLLPLPPFDVWLADYETHRLAHLKAGAPADPPSRSRWSSGRWSTRRSGGRPPSTSTGTTTSGEGTSASIGASVNRTCERATSSVKMNSKTSATGFFPSLPPPLRPSSGRSCRSSFFAKNERSAVGLSAVTPTP